MWPFGGPLTLTGDGSTPTVKRCVFSSRTLLKTTGLWHGSSLISVVGCENPGWSSTRYLVQRDNQWCYPGYKDRTGPSVCNLLWDYRSWNFAMALLLFVASCMELRDKRFTYSHIQQPDLCCIDRPSEGTYICPSAQLLACFIFWHLEF